jgi:hypothetical protein
MGVVSSDVAAESPIPSPPVPQSPSFSAASPEPQTAGRPCHAITAADCHVEQGAHTVVVLVTAHETNGADVVVAGLAGPGDHKAVLVLPGAPPQARRVAPFLSAAIRPFMPRQDWVTPIAPWTPLSHLP